MFELLHNLQSARLDHQKNNMSRDSTIQINHDLGTNPWLQDVLRHPPPYPMIAVPPNGGYWLEVPAESKRLHKRLWISKDECDKTTKAYADKFKGHEHQNYYGLDSSENPIVVSVKLDASKNLFDVIIRTNEKTEVCSVKENKASSDSKLSWLSQQVGIDCDCLYPVICPRASDMILKFDQHSIIDKFKFGILYKKFGQLTEEAVFGNRTHSEAMEEFLEMLGQKI
jgi:RAP1 GTPase activating protein 1